MLNAPLLLHCAHFFFFSIFVFYFLLLFLFMFYPSFGFCISDFWTNILFLPKHFKQLVLYVTSTFTCALCELLSFKKIIPLTLVVLDKLAPLQSAYQRKGQRISTSSRICQQFWHQSKETICFAFQAKKLVSLPRIFDPYQRIMKREICLFVVRHLYSFPIQCTQNSTQIQYFPNVLPKSKAFDINFSGNGEKSKFQKYRVAASFIKAEIVLQKSLFLAVLLNATKTRN